MIIYITNFTTAAITTITATTIGTTIATTSVPR